MPACGADSKLFKDIFGEDRMAEIFSDENLVQKWLDVEAALAIAESKVGLVPKHAASEIKEKAKSKNIDMAELKKGIDITGHPIVPLIRLLKKACDEEAGKYIHWGATTQDIMDSAVVLQLKEAYNLLEKQLKTLDKVMCRLAKKHRDTVMAGRTHGQHALPVTFGFKVSVWIAEIRRHMDRLEESKKRVLVGQFTGAAGTLASLYEHAEQVQVLLMKELKLGRTEVTWHNARDSFAELVCLMAMVSATCGKMANEVVILQSTEIGEDEENFISGNTVGSSTMPHKRNPMVSEGLIAAARSVKYMASQAIEAMDHEHERDMRRWAMEWDYIPRVMVMTSGVIAKVTYVLDTLVVKPERMLENLRILKGLINSEAVMLELGKYIGRQDAHDVVYEDSMKVYETGKSFDDILLSDPRLKGKVDKALLKKILDPSSYVGLSGICVDKMTKKD